MSTKVLLATQSTYCTGLASHNWKCVFSWKRIQIKQLGKYHTAASIRTILAFHVITELEWSSDSTQREPTNYINDFK